MIFKREYEQLAKKSEGLWNALTNFRNILKQDVVKITDADFSIKEYG